jgi:hypothetical protein
LKTLLAAALLFCAGSATLAQPVVLVTDEEARASRAAPPMLVPRAAPVKDAPVIEIVKPALQAVIASPTAIEVRFKATHPAAIKPDTFKVLYGAFQIDVTKRLTATAPITAQGIAVKEATLPSGRHRLNLSIEDSAGRVGSRQVDFEIL